jgi:type I restriction enzyme S subunit
MEERLPDGWVWTSLEAAVEIRDDLRIPVNADERAHRSGPYPYYGATGQVGWIDDYLMDGEYVLLGEDGAPFLDPVKEKAYIVSGKCWVNNHAHVLHCLEGMGNNRYLMYVLNAVDYHSVVNGTTRLKLTQSAMRQMFIPLAPFSEQNRIVAIIEQQFSRLDSGVASLHSAKAKTKQYRASLLKSAVEGELTKDWRAEHPASETGAELLKRILDERRARWEEEQLAKMREKGITPKDGTWKQAYEGPQEPDVPNLLELPEGWCWATVEQLLQEPPCNGISIKGSDRPPGFPALKLSAMSDFGFDYDDRRYIPISNDTAESLAIQKGDFFVSRGNGSLHLVGRGTLAQTPPECIVFPDTIIRLRFINISLLRYFIACIWSSSFVRKQIETKARTTAGIYKISQADVKSFILPLPPLSEQEQIVAEVEAQLSNIAQLEATIEADLRKAERDRQSILQEAFAGRLVPQDPNDEPASVLLERIREERKQREESEKVVRASRKGVVMGIEKRRRNRKAGTDQQKIDLYEKLVEVGQPLPPDDLFRRVGLKTDEQPESVETFYEELHADVTEGLISLLPGDTSVLLEALEPSAEMLARMQEEEEEAIPALQQAEKKEEVPALQQAEQHEKIVVDRPTLWDM